MAFRACDKVGIFMPKSLEWMTSVYFQYLLYPLPLSPQINYTAFSSLFRFVENKKVVE